MTGLTYGTGETALHRRVNSDRMKGCNRKYNKPSIVKFKEIIIVTTEEENI